MPLDKLPCLLKIRNGEFIVNLFTNYKHKGRSPKRNKCLSITKMTDTNKKVVVKSPKFPSISLETAVKVIQEASKHGERFKRESFATFGAKRSDSKSYKSGAFLRRIAALKYFGLIETKGDEIIFTEVAKKILAPKNDEERKETIIQCFLNPPLFQNLYNTHSKNTPIKVDDLANIAVREYGITLKAKKDFISSFIGSAMFAGLLKYAGDEKKLIVFTDYDKTPQGLKGTMVGPEEILKQKELQEGWNVVVKVTDENGNYFLEFRSKGRITGDSWNKLDAFIEAIRGKPELEKKFGEKTDEETGK